MSDKETKGAYLPFRELLEHKTRYSSDAAMSAWGCNRDTVAHYWSSIARNSKESLRHYDELLRLANMEEVK